MTLEARPDNAHPRTIFSVNHAPNPQRVGILQSLRAGAVRKSLVADLAREPEDRIAAHRIRAAIRSRGMGSAMHRKVGRLAFNGFPPGVEVCHSMPYSGMEHQSAVTYGNHFANGYLERDWTGV